MNLKLQNSRTQQARHGVLGLLRCNVAEAITDRAIAQRGVTLCVRCSFSLSTLLRGRFACCRWFVSRRLRIGDRRELPFLLTVFRGGTFCRGLGTLCSVELFDQFRSQFLNRRTSGHQQFRGVIIGNNSSVFRLISEQLVEHSTCFRRRLVFEMINRKLFRVLG